MPNTPGSHGKCPGQLPGEYRHLESTGKARKRLAQPAAKAGHTAGEPAGAKADVPGRFRLLKWNEVGCRGDFVAGGHQGFELWEGPSGFRADTFVQPVYRRARVRSTVPKR